MERNTTLLNLKGTSLQCVSRIIRLAKNQECKLIFNLHYFFWNMIMVMAKIMSKITITNHQCENLTDQSEMRRAENLTLMGNRDQPISPDLSLGDNCQVIFLNTAELPGADKDPTLRWCTFLSTTRLTRLCWLPGT